MEKVTSACLRNYAAEIQQSLKLQQIFIKMQLPPEKKHLVADCVVTITKVKTETRSAWRSSIFYHNNMTSKDPSLMLVWILHIYSSIIRSGVVSCMQDMHASCRCTPTCNLCGELDTQWIIDIVCFKSACLVNSLVAWWQSVPIRICQ